MPVYYQIILEKKIFFLAKIFFYSSSKVKQHFPDEVIEEVLKVKFNENCSFFFFTLLLIFRTTLLRIPNGLYSFIKSNSNCVSSRFVTFCLFLLMLWSWLAPYVVYPDYDFWFISDLWHDHCWTSQVLW